MSWKISNIQAEGLLAILKSGIDGELEVGHVAVLTFLFHVKF